MPLDYAELAPWHSDRKKDYVAYEAYKQRKAEEVLVHVRKLYPTIDQCIADIFSATSLTFRDDYRTPEGAMFGLSEPIGSVATRIPGFYMTGQNIFLRGICGTIMTSIQTVQTILHQ